MTMINIYMQRFYSSESKFKKMLLFSLEKVPILCMKIYSKVRTMKTYYTLFLKFMKEKEDELVTNLTSKTLTAFILTYPEY